MPTVNHDECAKRITVTLSSNEIIATALDTVLSTLDTALAALDTSLAVLDQTHLTLDTSSGANEQVTFTANGTDSFTIYGTMLVRSVANDTLESKWYAVETETVGLWELRWNVDNTSEDAGQPVVLKDLAPSAS